MSDRDLSRFVTLALEDEDLRRKIGQDPDAAFGGYDLSGEERQAIATADERKLRALGLDPMVAHSWAAFHDVVEFAPDMPDVPGDLPPRNP